MELGVFLANVKITIGVTMEEKHFWEWIELKAKLHNIGRVRAIHEGEIWWAAVGENIGVEINGKSTSFTRPVLIFKKLSKFSFLAVPLTSQEHSGSWYAPFTFKNKSQYAVLSQIRIMSVSRLNKRMGIIPNSDYALVRDGFRRLYLGEK
ncbi:type II toxin-antitoxin system PemK/MazF family toxin [Candidatus Saccharibacteria bacterium]|nr:type II toxin-antitoxin system PemK/MazF family toxin [Candidatus Saccharibacteria bacterium]